MEYGHHGDDQTVDLAGILNILWRRRWLVLLPPLLGLAAGLLYGKFGTKRWEAYATIRPGITAYDPSGGPVRQWQLKDITRWYEQELYRKDLVARLGLPESERPVITAEFIAQGLTNLQGGEVITLWTTATSPALAASLLDSSITLFNAYAESDSVSSQIKLTRDGLRLNILELENQLLEIDRLEGNLELRFQAARAESLMVAEQAREIGFDIEYQKRQKSYYLDRAGNEEGSASGYEAELDRLDGVMAQVASSDPGSRDEVPGWVRRDAVLDGGDVLQSLAQARVDLMQALGDARAAADSMALEADLADIRVGRLELKRRVTVAAKVREVEEKMGQAYLEKTIGIPAQRRGVELEISARKSKLSLLSPLQKVGGTVVSDKPVRPRPLRAILILVVLGGFGGFVLAFVWDYLARNRSRIFQSA
ncbi:MAG: Wzz/FepE/Etk N-terminal domain-containing protein [Candidatus Krumholzibacteriia bacterium]